MDDSIPQLAQGPIAAAHRRNHSFGHVVFPRITIPPAIPAPSSSSSSLSKHADPSSTTNSNAGPHSPTGRSASVPSTPALGAVSTLPATPEKESYTLSDLTSTIIRTTGQTPPPMTGSTCTIYKGKMYVFGGRPPQQLPSNSLYILDLTSLEWTLFDQNLQSTSNCILPTYRYDPSLDDRLHPLSPVKAWSNTSGTASSKKSLSTTTTSKPCARFNHSAVLVAAPPLVDAKGMLHGWGDESRAHLVIFGGRSIDADGSEVCLNDTHILDLESLQWLPTSLGNAPESPRDPRDHSNSPQTATHSPAMSGELSDEKATNLLPQNVSESPVSDDAMSASKTSSDEEQPQKHSPFQHHVPDPRHSHVASISGDRMVVIGGQGRDGESIKNISVLDLTNHVWKIGGEFPNECHRYQSTLAGLEERPMERRRRRYAESLVSERTYSMLSIESQLYPPSDDDTSSTVSRPASSLLSPLLNPRKNSWHRGEGNPFETFAMPDSASSRPKSNSTSAESDSSDTRSQQGKLSSVDPGVVKAHGRVGLGMDPEITKAMANSAGVPMTTHEAMARARQSSTSLSKVSSVTSSTGSSKSGDSTRKRSQSSQPPHPPTHSPPLARPHGRSKSVNTQGTSLHATTTKHFAKSSGSVFDLDDLATTIALKHKPQAMRKTSSNREAANSTVSIPESRLQTRRGSNQSTGSESGSFQSFTSLDETSMARKRLDSRSEKGGDPRRSLDSALETPPAANDQAGGARGSTGASSKPKNTIVAGQTLFMYSNNYPADEDEEPQRSFYRIQAARGSSSRIEDGKAPFVIKPEWTALDAVTSLPGECSETLPPTMYFPTAHIVNENFVLTGASTEDLLEPTPTEHPLDPRYPPHSQDPPPPPPPRRRHSFSVWYHHLRDHQWTQLELSKNLNQGNWNCSVTQAETRDEDHELGQSGFPVAIASFSHLVRVDLEGLEIAAPVDESSIGSAGVKLGLKMLRDGVAADLVLVSSIDGGRVRVNSGIVGQRWGYLQTLLEQREKMRKLEVEERTTKTKAARAAYGPIESMPLTAEAIASKQAYLSDELVTVMVPESMPVLVGFLQYAYTNELVTAHQHQLRTLTGLLLFAHLYDLTRLQQLVRGALVQQLCAENAKLICEIAALTHEFGLQTRALRTAMLQNRRKEERRQAEAAEAQRRLEFAMSRLDEIEEEKKRRALRMASQNILRGYHGLGE
ncbi:hypothetical protein BGW38_006969 [Lunasporangiospora selenospora]|uniref:Uncharacterized protein n=1 Tax=Lunasporangiospora selenospora TaxID=979761 RepID=A0A9P6KG32_9FUNG|nr:hypothetical protein BGW38_006969 [Lunasporangiospora selenospora]